VIYLSGAVRPNLPHEVGVMMVPPKQTRIPDGRVWAADTGMFANPAAFDLGAYLGWLKRSYPARDRCLFATAPDTVGDAVSTLSIALPVLPLIRSAGFPAALVAQDGLESLPVPWDAFDVLFVGGTTDWKLSEPAYELVAEAKRRGKWCHMGRVNSERRFRACAISGYDSVDGTYVVFGPDINIPKLQGWIDALSLQPVLKGGDAE
jgi:hypothetical protein